MENSTTITLAPGDFLIREKSGCDALYIIKEGQLEVYKTSSSGEHIPLALISSGQYVGEAALLLGNLNMSNVVALTPVTAVKLSRSSIEAQLKTVPPWLLTLAKGLVERLHHSNDLLRKNGWVDESLSSRLKAIEVKYKTEAKEKKAV